VLTNFLYVTAAAMCFIGLLLLYASYRDGDFELSLYGVFVMVGGVLALNTARKK
jgi:membrane-bound metal-dependent hydrolase YbcI (DUF457 family)